MIYARDEGGYGPLYTGFETRERGDPTSAAGWPAIVFNEITKDPRVRAGPYQAAPPQSFSNAFRIPSSVSILEEDAFDGRGLLPTKVISDVLYVYVDTSMLSLSMCFVESKIRKML